MATHSSVLAWRIPWTQEPGGLLSTGSHRVGHDWSDLAASWFSTSLPVSSVPLQLTFHPMCLMEPKLCLDHSYVSVLSGAGKNHQTVNIIATKCYDHQPQFPMLYDSKFSRHFSHYSTVISPFFFLSSLSSISLFWHILLIIQYCVHLWHFINNKKLKDVFRHRPSGINS